MSVRQKIEQVIRSVACEGDKQLTADFGEQTVLLESGLDSLDFAIIVARLEDELDMDPFTLMERPVYPRTLGEFISIYEGFATGRRAA